MGLNEIPNNVLLDELTRRLALREQTIQEQKRMLKQMKELNQKLEQSEALKSHFISNIKNEINNPLASILALSQTILSVKQSGDDELMKRVRMIHNEASVLDFQLDNIMTAAELEAGQAQPELVSADVTQIIRSVIQSFNYLVSKRRLEIVFNTDGDIHFVTDRHYFKVIIANLVSNAVKFSRDGSQISVVLDHCAENLAVSVSNVGKLIPGNEINKIFDRFTQLETGTVKKYYGHGLGLSVTKDLVQLLDGNVEVSSDPSSTRFRVSLPPRSSDSSIFTELGDGTEVFFDQAF